MARAVQNSCIGLWGINDCSRPEVSRPSMFLPYLLTLSGKESGLDRPGGPSCAWMVVEKVDGDVSHTWPDIAKVIKVESEADVHNLPLNMVCAYLRLFLRIAGS